jgi:hypothetical protein
VKKIIVRAVCIIGLAMLVFGWNFSGLAAQSGHNITLTWTAPASGGAPVTYNVLRGLSTGTETQLATVAAPTLTYVDSSGTGGVKYFYEVSATNTGGTGPVSNEVSATFLVSAPGAPAGLAATAN